MDLRKIDPKKIRFLAETICTKMWKSSLQSYLSNLKGVSNLQKIKSEIAFSLENNLHETIETKV